MRFMPHTYYRHTFVSRRKCTRAENKSASTARRWHDDCTAHENGDANRQRARGTQRDGDRRHIWRTPSVGHPPPMPRGRTPEAPYVRDRSVTAENFSRF